MSKKIILFGLFFLFVSGRVYSPMEINTHVSGSFGELRETHFHMGIDLRTGGAEGKKVFAVDDGYLSVISLQSSGYGKRLQIVHPNNKETVYAHLSSFSPKITRFITNIQRKKKKNELKVTLKPKKIPIKKGELIGLSGNTGSSEGPHLHFEVRNHENAMYYNPLHYLPEQNDTEFPKISEIILFPLSLKSNINGSHSPVRVRVKRKNASTYTLSGKSLVAFGKIGIAVHATDKSNPFSFSQFPYRFSLFENNRSLYTLSFDSLSFDIKKKIGGFRYSSYSPEKEFFHLFGGENEKTSFPYRGEANGIISFKKNPLKKITLVVCDFIEQCATLSFFLKEGEETSQKQKSNNKMFLKPGNSLQKVLSREYSLTFFPSTLSRSSFISHEIMSSRYSSKKLVVSGSVPLSSPMRVSLKKTFLDKSVSPQKIYIKNVKSPTSFISASYDGTFFHGFSWSYGVFQLAIDSQKPKFSLLSKKIKTSSNGEKSIIFELYDLHTKISDYNVWVNKKWIPCDYFIENARLICPLPSSLLRKQDYNIQAKATDALKNTSSLTAKISQ